MTPAQLKSSISKFALNKSGDLSQIIYYLNCLENPDDLLKELGLAFCSVSNSFVPINRISEIFNPEIVIFSLQQNKTPQGIKLSTDFLESLRASNQIFKDEILDMDVIGKPVTVYSDFSEDAKITTSSVTADSLRRGPIKRLPQIYSSRLADNFDPIVTLKPVHFFGWHKAPRESHLQKFTGHYYGIEIEMRFADKWGKVKFCNLALEQTNGEWFGERDGSLEREGKAGDCGVELVSKPYTLDDLEFHAKKLLPQARQLGGMGDAAGNFYGLHINCNLPVKSPDETARRFICLINEPTLRPFWEAIARRKATNYCEFKSVNFDTCLETEADRHYRAVFVRPRGSNCVEVRIFKSTINENTLLASVEAVHLAMMFANLDICKNFDVAHFLDYFASNASERLVSYLYHCRAVKYLPQLLQTKQLKNFNFSE